MANTTTTFADATEVRARVRTLWVVATGGDEGSVHGPFSVGGGTSLSGLRMLSAVRAEFGVRLAWQALQGAKNADDFAALVADQWTGGTRETAR
ncbi:acyl carrier protein [Actinophytocola sp. KF-1]